MKSLHLKSQRQVEMLDITRDVLKAVGEHKVNHGMAVIYTPHTTAAITINENADPDVCHDLICGINTLVLMDNNYRHLEGNSAAHIKSSLFGASETVIIHAGEAVLGTWQGIYFCEFDGPRERKVYIQVFGQ